jgi:hypothetical protein
MSRSQSHCREQAGSFIQHSRASWQKLSLLLPTTAIEITRAPYQFADTLAMLCMNANSPSTKYARA